LSGAGHPCANPVARSFWSNGKLGSQTGAGCRATGNALFSTCLDQTVTRSVTIPGLVTVSLQFLGLM